MNSMLQLAPNTSLETWVALGRQLYKDADQLTWQMADWAEFGDRVHHSLEQFCQLHRLSYSTIKQAAAVARAVPPSRRREQLLFGHHFEVSVLPPKDQGKWLEKAEREKLSALDLRKQIRDAQGQLDLVPDGKPLALPTRHSMQLIHFLTGQPAEFWTDSTKDYWRNELKPLVEWYQMNLA